MSWIDDEQVWLSENQSLQNAQLVVNHFYNNDSDWTKESICALIGNMRHESSINPNMYEYGYDWSADRGYGLVQWTPRSKYWNWAEAQGLSPRVGESQLARIDWEIENNEQWIANGHSRRYGREDRYDYSFANFRTNSIGNTLNQLVEAFMWNYEGPNYQAGQNSLSERQAFAQRAYDELDWSGGSDNGGDNGSHIISQVITIINEGKTRLENSISVNTDELAKAIMEGLKEIYNPPLYKQSKDFYSNTYFRLTKLFENMRKINPNSGLEELMKEIIDEAIDLIVVNIDIDGTFDEMIQRVNDIDTSGSGGGGGTEETPILPMSANNLYVTSEYGARNGRLHDGIDFGVGGNPTGQPVYAVMSGTVRAVHNSCHSFDSWGCGGEIGNQITIEHDTDGYTTRYIHLGQNSVPFSVGDKVKQGDQVGVMANSGSSQGIHLHFTVSTSYPIVRGEAIDGSSGSTVNPRNYISDIANVPTT